MKKAARQATYSAYELVGVEKRDLLKKRVDQARDEQKEAGEDFGDSLARLKAVYGFQGGDLERKYDELKSSFENASSQSQSVRQSIQRVENVANDLFKEWDSEIELIQSAALKTKSRQKLTQTRQRYDQMHQALKAAESRMGPVLTRLQDHVLYLKHNLNSQAIGSLKSEALKIEDEIEGLISQMNRSIKSADQFIHQME